MLNKEDRKMKASKKIPGSRGCSGCYLNSYRGMLTGMFFKTTISAAC
jgi:hypothetical protein